MPMWMRPVGDGEFARRAARALVVTARLDLEGSGPAVPRGTTAGIHRVAGLAFANVMTGTVLVENIFAWPGIGQYAYRSATTLDLPAIMGVTLFVAVVYILVNLVVDVLHAAIDPRIRLA